MTSKQSTISPDAKGITRAAAILRDGGLVAIPTETVYGLAARADSADAVAQIYRTKGRPDFNPLIARPMPAFGTGATQITSQPDTAALCSEA